MGYIRVTVMIIVVWLIVMIMVVYGRYEDISIDSSNKRTEKNDMYLIRI